MFYEHVTVINIQGFQQATSVLLIGKVRISNSIDFVYMYIYNLMFCIVI